MSFKKLIGRRLSLELALGLALPVLAEGGALEGRLVILHTNDVHGRAVSANGVWGYAAITQVKKDLEAQGAQVLLLDAGDASQGTPLVNLDYGKTAFEFMNAAGYDAMAPGNHELDWGIDNLLQNAELANFPILAANITDKISGELKFKDHVIFEKGDFKVGVFGLDTPEAMTKTHPDKVRGITFAAGEELYACAQAQVDALKEAGCNLIVCVGHLGVDDESTGNRSIDVIANTTGIDLFIDGHSHTVIDGGKEVKSKTEGVKTLLVSTGEYFGNIGYVVFDGEKLTAKLWKCDSNLLSDMYKPCDAEVAAVVNGRNEAVEAQLSAAFAKTEVDLDGNKAPGVRTQETNLGDFAADAILWSAQQAMGEQVVAALTNGGGIRASIKAGDITMKDMKTIFPFGNQVSVLTVTGAELLEALEAATFSTPDAIGAFPQVAGIVFTIDTTVPFEQGEQYPDSTYFAPKNPGARVTIETVAARPLIRTRCTPSPPTISPPRAAIPTMPSSMPMRPPATRRAWRWRTRWLIMCSRCWAALWVSSMRSPRAVSPSSNLTATGIAGQQRSAVFFVVLFYGRCFQIPLPLL